MERWLPLKLLAVIVCGLLLANCGGFGVQDADKQAREGQARVAQSESVGFSIWSMFGSSRQAVRKRLDPGLGKTKAEQIVTFGQPFQCKAMPAGGEICGWYDAGMSDGGPLEPTRHRVFYTYDQEGIAREWIYQGIYGKLSSVEMMLPEPPAGPAS